MHVLKTSLRSLAGPACTLLLATNASAAVPPATAPLARVAPAPAPLDIPQLLVSGDKLTRTVDCAGARANVVASDGAVTLKRCVQIIVAGNHERVMAELTPESSILVLGDHDVVRWRAAEGISPVVRDQGRNNVTAPL